MVASESDSKPIEGCTGKYHTIMLLACLPDPPSAGRAKIAASRFQVPGDGGRMGRLTYIDFDQFVWPDCCDTSVGAKTFDSGGSHVPIDFVAPDFFICIRRLRAERNTARQPPEGDCEHKSNQGRL